MKKIFTIALSTLFLLGAQVPTSFAVEYKYTGTTVIEFKSDESELTISQKSAIKAAIEAKPEAERFICGAEINRTASTKIKTLAKKRAESVCSYIKLQRNSAITDVRVTSVSKNNANSVKLLIGTPISPLVKNQLSLSSSAKTFYSVVPFTFEYLGPTAGLEIVKWCIESPTHSGLGGAVSSLRIGMNQVQLDSNGCVEPNQETRNAGSFSLDTTKFPDGRHTLTILVTAKDVSERVWTLDQQFDFKVDNNSLEARAPHVGLNGQFIAGETLTGVPGSWDAGTTTTYQWYSGGEAIYGANGISYVLSGRDVGRTISFAVVAANSFGEEFTKLSPPSQVIGPQSTYPASDYTANQSQTVYNVKETEQKYNSVTRQYETVTINNYNVYLTHPSNIACSSYSCEIAVKASWSGQFQDNYEWLITTVYLIDSVTGTTIDSDSLYLSGSSSATDDLSFSVSRAGSFRLKISNVSYATLTDSGASTISVVRSPNTNGALVLSRSDSMGLVQMVGGRVYSGTSSSINWYLWEYKLPTSVDVISRCMLVPVYLAPLSLSNGQVGDWTTNNWSDAELSVTDAYGVEVDRLKISGNYGGWNNLVRSNRVELKLCGLNPRLGTTAAFYLSVKLRYDSFNLENAYVLSQKITTRGSLRYTKINCFSGELGLVVDDFEPQCPTGWTQTKAAVKNGKITMTTINCISGTEVEVVRHPDPVCPAGFKKTDLAVKNGKLVPWTITCVKGLLVKKVTAVFPSCPAGYSRK